MIAGSAVVIITGSSGCLRIPRNVSIDERNYFSPSVIYFLMVRCTVFYKVFITIFMLMRDRYLKSQI